MQFLGSYVQPTHHILSAQVVRFSSYFPKTVSDFVCSGGVHSGGQAQGQNAQGFGFPGMANGKTLGKKRELKPDLYVCCTNYDSGGNNQ